MSYLNEVPHFKAQTSEELNAAAEEAGKWIDQKTGEPLTDDEARKRVVSAKSVTDAVKGRLNKKVKNSNGIGKT